MLYDHAKVFRRLVVVKDNLRAGKGKDNTNLKMFNRCDAGLLKNHCARVG